MYATGNFHLQTLENVANKNNYVTDNFQSLVNIQQMAKEHMSPAEFNCGKKNIYFTGCAIFQPGECIST